MDRTIINGQVATSLSINDRGLNYGDGFFTTAKVSQREVELWPLHIARLQQCATRLGFPELDIAALEVDVDALIAMAPSDDYVLKIVYTRGSGGRGYAPPTDAHIQRIVRLMPYPTQYQTLVETGLSLSIAQTRLAQQPLLAGMKTLNRLEQVLVKQEAAKASSDDMLVLDTTDNVIETSSANLLLYQQGQWFTPKLDQAGVKGVYLTHLSQHLAVREQRVNLATLFSVDALYCCNSLMGVIPIKRLAHHDYNVDISKSVLSKALNNKGLG